MKRQKVKLKVYSKINLSLNILGVSNNLHMLDMVVTSVSIADVITICERFDNKINVEFDGNNNPFADINKIDKNNNSVTSACLFLRSKTGDFGADIFVEKNVPLSGGLGGSGVDAAGIILGLDNLFGLKKRGVDLTQAALNAGSDVPYLLEGGCRRVRAYGDELTKIDSKCNFSVVICNKEPGVSSKESYLKFDELNKSKKLVLSDNDRLINSLTNGDYAGVYNEINNALFAGSKLLNPGIEESINALNNQKAIKSFMTGSGNCCVGIFENDNTAKIAADNLRKQGFFAKSANTVNKGFEFLEI